MRSGWGYGSGWSRTAFTTEKMAVLAPMPSASAVTAVAVNPGLRLSKRQAYCRSARKPKLPHYAGAEGAAFGGDRNLAETLRALLGAGIGRRFATVNPGHQGIHGRHHEKINRAGDHYESKQPI